MELSANYIKRIEIDGLWDRFNIVWDLSSGCQYTIRNQWSWKNHYPESIGRVSRATVG